MASVRLGPPVQPQSQGLEGNYVRHQTLDSSYKSDSWIWICDIPYLTIHAPQSMMTSFLEGEMCEEDVEMMDCGCYNYDSPY